MLSQHHMRLKLSTKQSETPLQIISCEFVLHRKATQIISQIARHHLHIHQNAEYFHQQSKQIHRNYLSSYCSTPHVPAQYKYFLINRSYVSFQATTYLI